MMDKIDNIIPLKTLKFDSPKKNIHKKKKIQAPENNLGYVNKILNYFRLKHTKFFNNNDLRSLQANTRTDS